MRFVQDIPVRPAEEIEVRAPARGCAIAGCRSPGAYRAPKSRDRVNEYIWLCLDHVREYNAGWDFFRGMSDREVERFIRDNAIGHRPTWQVGTGKRRLGARAAGTWFDPYGMLGEGPGLPGDHTGEPARRISALQREALEVLGLDDAATLNDVKARYKELVKRYHPDANGGDRSSEERLKRVIRAYRALRASNLA